MKNTVYAIIAASLAMLATSGIVALATAAPPPTPAQRLQAAEAELVAHLDQIIAAQLTDIKQRILTATR